QPSGLLLALFGEWVLAPFVALAAAATASVRWAALTRVTLYGLTLLVAVGSLGIYGPVALGRPQSKPAAAFVLVPPASGLLAAGGVCVAASTVRRRSHRSRGA
ncbi:MAG TPA: hypothetical protein VGD56_00315, partial [Gemmatirosa sp.]